MIGCKAISTIQMNIVMFEFYLKVAFSSIWNRVSAGWDDAFRGNTMLYETIDLDRLAVVYPRNLERDTQQFLDRLIELSRKMGFNIRTPKK